MWHAFGETSGDFACDVSCEFTALLEYPEVAPRGRSVLIPVKGVLSVCVVSFRLVLLQKHPFCRVDPQPSCFGCPQGVTAGLGVSAMIFW